VSERFFAARRKRKETARGEGKLSKAKSEVEDSRVKIRKSTLSSRRSPFFQKVVRRNCSCRSVQEGIRNLTPQPTESRKETRLAFSTDNL
tara:strand:+ start:379 stop:648 length:270 start_codon:yes stop_codon:yes gene_type:complete